MNASDWIAGVGTFGTLVGIPTTIAVTRAMWKPTNRTAVETEALSRIAAEQRAEEKQRWHDDHFPSPPAKIEAEFRPGTPNGSLFGSITVPRAYRVRADGVFASGGSTQITFERTALRPGPAHEFHIEMWHPDQVRPVIEKVRFRFWPPLKTDGLGTWTCDCGEPTGESPGDRTDGHWEWLLPVEYELRRPRYRSFERRGDE